MARKTCAGLEVVKCTLKDEWDRSAYSGMGPAVFDGVSGTVEIEITPACALRDEVCVDIAEVMAGDWAREALPHNIEVIRWKVQVNGRRITCKSAEDADIDPDSSMVHRWGGHNQHAADVRPSGGW